MTITASRGLAALIAKSRSDSAGSTPRWAALCLASLPVLSVGGWAIAAAVQPPASYSPVRQTVSVLAGHAATHRWIVTTSLCLMGACYLAGAAGLRLLDPVARVCLVVAGVAALGVAAFPEPAHGSSGRHVVCTVIGAVTIAFWPALVARPGSVAVAAIGRRRSAAAVVASLVLGAWLAIQARDGSALGLAERVSSALQVTWPAVVALALRRQERLYIIRSGG